MMLPILKTQNLIIRPLTLDDLDAVHRTTVDAGWSDDSPDARQKRLLWLEWSVRNCAALASLKQPPYGERAVTLTDDTFIGMVGIVPCLDHFGVLPYFRERGVDGAYRNAEVGLFWSVQRAYRGRGYATEAARALIDTLFESYALGRVVATTDNDNHASQRVMHRLGMIIQQNPHPEPHWLQTVGILENQTQPGQNALQMETTTRE